MQVGQKQSYTPVQVGFGRLYLIFLLLQLSPLLSSHGRNKGGEAAGISCLLAWLHWDVFSRTPSFLFLHLGNSFVLHGLHLAHRLPIDKVPDRHSSNLLENWVVLLLWFLGKQSKGWAFGPPILRRKEQHCNRRGKQKQTIPQKPNKPKPSVLLVLQGRAVNPLCLGDLQHRAVLRLLSG